jgi:hypothetical protein
LKEHFNQIQKSRSTRELQNGSDFREMSFNWRCSFMEGEPFEKYLKSD